MALLPDLSYADCARTIRSRLLHQDVFRIVIEGRLYQDFITNVKTLYQIDKKLTLDLVLKYQSSIEVRLY
ncbi:hypothetical protein GJ496_005414 [Pomphorhynchus laevis]|nr:hypothetical protein GJ496_005414 [Pomphorhynchus laevis]